MSKNRVSYLLLYLNPFLNLFGFTLMNDKVVCQIYLFERICSLLVHIFIITMNLISINVLQLKIFIPIRYNDFIVFKLKMIYTVTEEYEMKGR